MMTRTAPTPHAPTLQRSAAHGTTSFRWIARRSPWRRRSRVRRDEDHI